MKKYITRRPIILNNCFVKGLTEDTIRRYGKRVEVDGDTVAVVGPIQLKLNVEFETDFEFGKDQIDIDVTQIESKTPPPPPKTPPPPKVTADDKS